MRVRWACGGGHGAVPAWAGCLMILGLYPALRTSLPPAGSPITPELIAARAHSTRAAARFCSVLRSLFAIGRLWRREDLGTNARRRAGANRGRSLSHARAEIDERRGWHEFCDASGRGYAPGRPAYLRRRSRDDSAHLTDFILRNVLRAADAVIDQAERVVFSERDSLRVLELLEHPPAPNARLIAAARALSADT